jgi:hypothetical protein
MEVLTMINEKKIWLCEQYAQKAWGTSQRFAQEAANAGIFGKGYAVVAEETRTLADKLFDYAAKARFEGNDSEFKGVVDFSVMMGYLATNASIEILNVERTGGRIEAMLVLAEDIRNISLGLRSLNEKMADVTSPSYVSPFVMPEITSQIKSSRKTDWFFRFSVNGVTLVENTANIWEICFNVRKKDVGGGTLSLRGHKIPIIDCGQILTELQTVMMVCPDGNRYMGSNEKYAVPIDELDINTIFLSRIGCNAPPKAEHPFAEYARECWDVLGGDQLIFLDWQKLISR